MQLRLHLPYILFFLLLIGVGFALTFNSLDPDFGWHIRTGELILEKGIPQQDWFTFTMPSFAWIDHEWLLHIFMYKAYEFLGIHGMQLLFVVIYTPAFFIFKKRSHPFWIFTAITFLAYMSTIDFLGIRPQILTPVFVAILLWLVDRFLEKSSKVIYLVPPLILAWTNLHASFSAGILILVIVIACQVWKKSPPRQVFTLAFVTVLSLVATLVNPYGIKIYGEILSVIGDSYLKFHITEWNPLFMVEFKPLIVLYISIVIALAIKQYKKLPFHYLVLSAVFLLLTLSSVRYFLIFAIVSLPIALQATTQTVQEIPWSKCISLFKHAPLVYKGTVFLLPTTVIVCFGLYFYNASEWIFRSDTKDFYPSAAISFLKTLPLSENMFNDYSWGGYLIWQIPERKVFIDGRMPSWRLPAQAGQSSQFLFKEYNDVIATEPGFETTLEKYQISFAVIQPKEKLANALKESGWENIYEDPTTIVLKKP